VIQEQSPQDDELIPVVYGRDLAEANYYLSLLDDHEIPAVIHEGVVPANDDDEKKSGIPVLVSEEYLAEAQDIIEQSTVEDDDFDEDMDDLEEEDEFADFQEEDMETGGFLPG
jgi:hypothetical protein